MDDPTANALMFAKLHLMEADLEADPDHEDRVPKREVVRSYAAAVCQALEIPSPGTEQLPWDSARSVAEDLAARGDSLQALQAELGTLADDARRYVLSSQALAKRALADVTTRRQALVLLVELAAFQPWPAGTEWEGDLRRLAIADLIGAVAAPIDIVLYREIDRDLAATVKRLSRSEVDRRRVAMIATGVAAAGIVTGGLAAPLVGAAVGGSLGLSGAAATSAGLALLGGGSTAAGGLGVAGGTALVAGALGGGGASASAARMWLRGAEVTDVTLEAAKLEVLFEYALLREANTEELRRLVVESVNHDIDELTDTINQLTETAHDVAEENATLKAELSRERTKRQVLEDTVASMRRRQGEKTA